ncbi:MAG: hypothetical protein M0P19_07380, partial [Nevskia sp.]|nr:hypothetical protein [Nevskia sp.]
MFRSEFVAPAAGSSVRSIIAISNLVPSGAGYRRNAVNITGNSAAWQSVNGAASQSGAAVSLTPGKTYVVEFTTTASGTAIYLSEKGGPRGGVFSHTDSVADWGSIRSQLWVYRAPGYAESSLSIDNVTETTGTASDLIAAASGANDQTTTVQYDALNRVIQDVDAQGTTTTYTYDAQSGYLTSSTRAQGQLDAQGVSEARTTTTRYDALGRVISTIQGEGSAALVGASDPNAIFSSYGTQYSYDLAGRRVSSTDANGRTTYYYYDGDNNLRYTVNAAGEVSETQYDAFGETIASIAYAQRISTASLKGGLISGDSTFTTRVNATAFQTDANNRTTAYDYADKRGLLTQTIDAAGYLTQRIYDAFGALQTQTQDVGATPGAVLRSDQYSYDARGLTLQSVTDSGGLALTSKVLQYDAFGRALQTQDANGGTRSTAYDRLGRVVTVTDALGQSATTTYDAFDNVLSQTDRNGQTTRYAYSDTGRSITVTTPEGIVTIRKSNRYGQTIAVTDGENNTTTYRYDKDGRLTHSTDALGNDSESQYDKAGLLLATFDARRVQTTYAYDAVNRVLTRTQDPSGLNLITRYDYSAFGDTIKVTDANNVVTETVYNRKSQALYVIVDTVARNSASPALNIATAYTYDAEGRNLSVAEGITATGSSGSFVVNSASALRTTQYSYDKAGRRITTIADAGVGRLNITTGYAYDKNNNLIRSTDAKGNITRYFYDANGRQTYTVNALGGVVETRYDGEGRAIRNIAYANTITPASLNDGSTSANVTALISVNASRDRSTRQVYDRDGRLAYTINALGAVTSYQYDDNGRVIDTVRYATALDSTQLAALGAAPNAAALAARFGEGLGNTLQPGQSLLPGQSIYSAGGAYRLTYQTDGNLVLYSSTNQAIWNSGTNGTTPGSAVYQADGNLVVYNQQGQAVWATSTYPYGAGQLQVREDGNIVITGSNGNAAWTSNAANTNYIPADQHTRNSYDAAGRLTQTIDAEGYSERYSYDAAGNRTSLTNKNGSTTTYIYDAANRLIEQDAPPVYVYSGTSGTPSLVSQKTRLVYDGLGNIIVRVENFGDPVNSRVSRYFYDALGNQTRVDNDSVYVLGATTYGKQLGVYDPTGDAANGYGSDRTKFEINSTIVRSFTWYDALGNAVVGGNAGDNVAGVYTYKLYDANGRLSYEVDGQRQVTAYAYDANGNVLSLRRYSGAISETAESSAGANDSLQALEAAIRQGINTGAAVRGLALAASARVATLVATLSTSGSRLISTTYDALDRKTQVVQPTVDYYLPAADGSVVSGSGAPTTTYTYDTFSELTAQRDLRNPQAGQWITTYFGYDAAGRQTDQLDALGYYTKSSYDAQGRLSQTTQYAKAQTIGLDGTGNPAFASFNPLTTAPSANDPAGYDRVTQYGYDRLDRLTSETRHNIRSYTLDASFNPVLNTGDATRRTAYDGVGNVISTTDAQGATTVNYYDALGRLIGVQAPSRSNTVDYSRISIRSVNATATLASTSAISVQYDSLRLWGAGDARITVTYESDYTAYTYEYEYDPEFNTTRTIAIPYTAHGTFTTSVQRIAGESDTGATLTLPGDRTNVVIRSLKVEKSVNGSFITVHDTTQVGYQPRLELSKLPSTVANLTFGYRTAGSTGAFTALTATKTGEVWFVPYSALAAGNYEYQLTATNSSGGAVDLTGVGGPGTAPGSINTFTSTITVSRPAGSPSTITSGSTAATQTPLTVFRYDALGNQLAQIRFASPNVPPPSASGVLPAGQDTANDQYTYYAYDILGRVIQTTDAAGKVESQSYDIFGRVARTWRTVTDALNQTHQQLQLYQYDRVGQQTDQFAVDGASSGVALGTHTSATFNAFGEQISRSVSRQTASGSQAVVTALGGEFYDYDADGRLWQTNADGVTKAYRYDLQGHVTQEALISGT